MNRFLLPTLSILVAGLFMGSPAIAQDLPQTVVIGRPPEAAPLETSQPSETLSDAIERIPDIDYLDGTDPESQTTLKSERWAFVAVFEGPCHFPERLNDAARSLVIYEGMQVVVDKDGRYEVSMIAEVPLTPVAVRLQLRVTEFVGNQRVDHGTITLPPIVMETSQETTDQHPSNTVRIRRSGYSHLLHRLMKANKGTIGDISLSRSGVTRFGSIPEAANYSISNNEDSANARRSN